MFCTLDDFQPTECNKNLEAEIDYERKQSYAIILCFDAMPPKAANVFFATIF
jgi:hypothetical protein